MTLRFLHSNAPKMEEKSADAKLKDLINEACPDIKWTINKVDKDKLWFTVFKDDDGSYYMYFYLESTCNRSKSSCSRT